MVKLEEVCETVIDGVVSLYLDHPVTTKESGGGKNARLEYGVAGCQGWRTSMEDAHLTLLDLDPATHTALFSVFDGHGGKVVAQFCARHLGEALLATEGYQAGDLGRAITEAQYHLDVLLASEEGKEELRQLGGAPPAAAAAAEDDTKALKPVAVCDSASEISSEEGQHVQQARQAQQAGAGAGAGAGDCASGAESSDDDDEEEEEEEEDKPKPAAAGSGLGRIKRSPSENFLVSHLVRASVIPTPAAPGAAAAGGDTAAAAEGGDGAGLAPVCEKGEDEVEEEGKDQPAWFVGCTAVSILVRGDQIIVANTGDSRCVLSRDGRAVTLTMDHKPGLYSELRRINKAGGSMTRGRINGMLNVSRAIGDLHFKNNKELPPDQQMVVATPDIEAFSLRPEDEFAILACDGIWDVVGNQEAVDFVRRRLREGMDARAACEALCDACLAPDLQGECRGADNMSVAVVLFRNNWHCSKHGKHAKPGGKNGRRSSGECAIS